MDFGKALRHLRDGRRVTRDGWNGPDQWLILVPGSVIRVERNRPLGKAVPNLIGHEVKYGEHIDIKTTFGTIQPWTATQSDLLAYDWLTIESVLP